MVSGGSATISNNPTRITGFTTGVDVDGGTALIETTNLNGNTVGLLIQNAGLVDAGQETPGTDFTGLGISAGGNDFSGYTAAATATSGAIVNVNSDAVTGRQGAPNDVFAAGNTFSTSNLADVESVIWHDIDNSNLGFVDYASFGGSILNLEPPCRFANHAVDLSA